MGLHLHYSVKDGTEEASELEKITPQVYSSNLVWFSITPLIDSIAYKLDQNKCHS